MTTITETHGTVFDFELYCCGFDSLSTGIFIYNLFVNHHSGRQGVEYRQSISKFKKCRWTVRNELTKLSFLIKLRFNDDFGFDFRSGNFTNLVRQNVSLDSVIATCDVANIKVVNRIMFH